MPPPRKVDLLPPELRQWLQEALKASGFGGYEQLADDLNARLEETGLELRIGKSALHAFGQDYRAYQVAEKRAQEEIRAFLTEASLADEVDVTSALFQQLTTLQFRLQMTMADPDGLPGPREMKDLTQALNNLIRSTSMRETIARSVKADMADKLDEAAQSGSMGLTAETIEAIKAQILGVAA